MLLYREIIEMRSVGLSQEKVSFLCGCSVEKVRSVCERARMLGLQWPVPMEFSEEELRLLVDPEEAPRRFQPKCKEIFDRVCNGGIPPNLTRRHFESAWAAYLEDAAEEGVPPYAKSRFREIYAKWHKERSAPPKMRINWTPGEEIQVDWAGSTLTLHGADGTTTPAYLFVATSPYSDYTFVRASLDMNMQSWLEHHRHMFEFFGGVPLFLVPDNLATAVTVNTKVPFGNRRRSSVNRRYQEMADHYNVLVAPTRAKVPTDKGAVEGHVKMAGGGIIGILKQLRFTSIDQLNYAIGELLDVFNERPMPAYGISRKELFQEEAKHLGPLPEKPFASVTWQKCKASSDSVVNVRGVYYGIPESYANQKVVARISDDFVDIFERGRRQLLAHHERHPDGSETFEGFAGRRPDRFKPLDEWAEQNHREPLLGQWHPVRNDGLNPHDVVCHSSKQVWWRCSDCGYEWQEAPYARIKRSWDNCLACAGVDLVPGRNDLATLRPDIAAEWHPTKNGLSPSDVFPDYRMDVWWIGADCGHEWRESIARRTGSAEGSLCPYCSGKKALPGFNDVATLCPQLAKCWHPVKNRERKPENTSACSTSRVYLLEEPLSDILLESPRSWMLRNGYEEKIEPFLKLVREARSIDASATLKQTETPGDDGKASLSATEREEASSLRWYRYSYARERGMSLAEWCEHASRHDLLEQWHPEKNGDLTPEDVSRSSDLIVWWRCEHGHEWDESIIGRTLSDNGCSVCARSHRVLSGTNDLASCRPGLLKWFSEKNGDLAPEQVSDRYSRQVWWECPSCGFEWQRPAGKISGEGLHCPACEGWVTGRGRNILVPGVNDLAAKRPRIAAQWHPTKNRELTPEHVTWRSGKSIWWRCERGHEWEATIANRTRGRDCPYCSNQRTLPGFNDLATAHPEIAAEWHPTKNLPLQACQLVSGSHEKVWWRCEKGHEWQAAVKSRTKLGNGCPYCGGKKALPGFNDLATTHPELAAQWSARNGDLGADAVTAGSQKAVWWLGECGHEWDMAVYRRVKGENCPICAGKRVLPGFNDLLSRSPDVAARWHPEKNGRLGPDDVMHNSHKVVWWLGECGHEWEEQVLSYSCSKRVKCPFCAGKKVLPGFNDLATTHPELAAQWHPRQNKKLTPRNVTAQFEDDVWWACPVGHVWKSSVRERALEGRECCYCLGEETPERPVFIPGQAEAIEQWRTERFAAAPEQAKQQRGKKPGTSRRPKAKDKPSSKKGQQIDNPARRKDPLTVTHPHLVAEWHPDKNGDLKPDAATAGSNKRVWWRCEKGHEWEVSIDSRTRHETGCPYCKNRKVLKGFNDLATIHPRLAAEWSSRNQSLRPDAVLAGTHQVVWWKCAKGHEWKASVSKRSHGWENCPYCEPKSALAGCNDLATKRPDLAAQWHPDKNGDLGPENVACKSNQSVWWRCEKGHEWQARVANRTSGRGCPYCKGKKVLLGFNDLATKRPDLAEQWHPDKNGDLKPDAVTVGSDEKVWWRCEKGHEWQAAVYQRSRGTQCPHCRENQRRRDG